MNDETIEGIIETQKLQTNTIQELLSICTMLKDKVEALEGDIKKITSKKNYLPVTHQSKDIPLIRIDGDGYTGGIEVQGRN